MQVKQYIYILMIPVIVIIQLTILSLLAILFGYIASDLYIGIGYYFISQSVFY